MRAVILFNPVAGRGRAEGASRELAQRLCIAGMEPLLLPSERRPAAEWLLPALSQADLLIVAGGDGALRMAAPSAASAGVRITHYPLGTENLFARAMGMRRDPDQLLAAIQGGAERSVDLASIDGVPFVLMASIGFDAEVVHDLTSRRRGGISHLSYAMPILRRVVGWRASRCCVRVDDRVLVDDQRGMVIAANMSVYAQRIDPASRAVDDDGRLDVIFLPAANALSLPRWACLGRMGRALEEHGAVAGRGERIEIRADPPGVVQIDGDALDPGHPKGVIQLLVRHRALRVLVP